jgi:glycosyltransferase involved in cell wall biosynthesis
MSGSSSARILIYDPLVGGHHAEYVLHLIRERPRFAPETQLHVGIREALIHSSPELKHALDSESIDVRVHLVDEVESSSLWKSASKQVQEFKRLIKELRPEHALSMYADHLQFGLATTLRFPFSVHIAGIFFRPTFHQEQERPNAHGLKARIQSLRKSVLFAAAMRNPHLKTAFCLDPFASEKGSLMWTRVAFRALPDPMDTEVRAEWGGGRSLDDTRRNVLVFGVLDDRKGLRPLLEAVRRLSDAEAERLRIVMVGAVPEGAHWLYEEIESTCQSTSADVQIHPGRVPDDQIQRMIASFDLVSLLYQSEHIGSSGVLIRAAAAGVPVMATQKGLVGHYVTEHHLGMTVDAERPEAIQKALQSWLEDGDLVFDVKSAQAFASMHTPESYARTIYQELRARK